MRLRSVLATLAALAAFLFVAAFARDARAAGTFVLKTKEATEVSGAWHLYVTIELPKAPPIAHQSMRFLFTKTMVYERALVDGHDGPVLNRQALQNQTPSVESLDVDFADPSGKIFKGTRFDFGLTRARGYEAGEYTVEVRTSDGVTVGSKANLVLKGDNDVVDRRSIAFNTKDKSVTKVAAVDAGAKPGNGGGDEEPVAANNNMGEVQASGTAKPFIPEDAYKETDEEKIKTKPKGCGCDVPGAFDPGALLWLSPAALAVGAFVRRRRARAA